MKTPKQFTLNCTDEGFQQRQKNVFDQILAIETAGSAKKVEPMDVDNITKKFGNRSETKSFRGKESIFKMPKDPVPKNFLKHLPDYKKNPHKWTKYSLEDVKDEDISEKSNRKAALSFLKELKQRNDKTEGQNIEGTSDTPKRIIFQKHTQISAPEEVLDDKPSFSSSKIVMPEYVVGQKIKKEKKNKSIKMKNRTKELRLDHLLQEEDEIE